MTAAGSERFGGNARKGQTNFTCACTRLGHTFRSLLVRRPVPPATTASNKACRRDPAAFLRAFWGGLLATEPGLFR